MPLIEDLTEAVSIEGAVDVELLRSYRERVEKITDNPELKAKAVSILNKLEAQRQIEERMDRQPAMKDLPPKDLWRLFLDGKQQAERGEYGFENEMGYMAGLMSGFVKVLDTLGQPLDSTAFESLHDLAVGGVYDTKGGKPAIDDLRMKSKFRTEQFATKNLMTGEVGTSPGYVQFGLSPDTQTTKGLEEFRERRRSEEERGVKWFDVREPGTKPGLVTCLPKSPEEIKARVDGILRTCNTAIAGARSPEQKLKAMARCCQDLDQSHVFQDGNIRTVVFLVLNKMLLENGMDPVIMEEPNVFDAFGGDELVAEIQKGQARFREVTRAPRTPVSGGDPSGSPAHREPSASPAVEAPPSPTGATPPVPPTTGAGPRPEATPPPQRPVEPRA